MHSKNLHVLGAVWKICRKKAGFKEWETIFLLYAEHYEHLREHFLSEGLNCKYKVYSWEFTTFNHHKIYLASRFSFTGFIGHKRTCPGLWLRGTKVRWGLATSHPHSFPDCWWLPQACCCPESRNVFFMKEREQWEGKTIGCLLKGLCLQ